MHIIVYCRYTPVSFSYMYIVAYTCMNTYVNVYISVICVVMHPNSLCQYCSNVEYVSIVYVCEYKVHFHRVCLCRCLEMQWRENRKKKIYSV